MPSSVSQKDTRLVWLQWCQVTEKDIFLFQELGIATLLMFRMKSVIGPTVAMGRQEADEIAKD